MVRSPGTATRSPSTESRGAAAASSSGPHPRPSAPPHGSSSYRSSSHGQRRVRHLHQVEVAVQRQRVRHVDVGVAHLDRRRTRHQPVHQRVEHERVVRARRDREVHASNVARNAPTGASAASASRIRQAARSRGPTGLETVRTSANGTPATRARRRHPEALHGLGHGVRVPGRQRSRRAPRCR